jgi:hypothetical protein
MRKTSVISKKANDLKINQIFKCSKKIIKNINSTHNKVVEGTRVPI